ncbi:hypothetical protein [Cuspidothrix issatschenkoi]|uniref:Uncharacterized protein n=1 Tax=Cuspidothrix issatschenkoi CHARLIE-1 TaxID=2052836 RepID=A0A2S6CRT0_9CYAN|nr:hypothetical protein [Cuspidothrix issatschenkoi]PPJ62468.1 hypothetical protein CUN59_15400 [Cuspidothrix issatschenkoi CHARLIE-1]
MQWIEQLQGQTVALDTAPLIIFEYGELTSQRLRDRSSSHLQNSKLLAAALRYRTPNIPNSDRKHPHIPNSDCLSIVYS